MGRVGEDYSPWNRRTVAMIILLAGFQLIISVVYLTNIVWVVNWESSVAIAQGTHMYDQTGGIYTEGGKYHSLPPQHFPIYFYMMAGLIKVFGTSPLVGRTVMWLFSLFNYFIVLRLIEPRTELEINLVSVIYFLDPLLISINLSGKHDQITMTFILLGILSIKKRYPAAAGVSLGLGIMMKFFPVFPAIVAAIYYLKRKEFRDLMRYVTTLILTIGSIFGYFYARWGEKFLDVVEFQATRNNDSLSIFHWIIPDSTPEGVVLAGQFSIYFLSFLYLLRTNVEYNWWSVSMASGFLSAVFIVFNRQYYTSYAYFAIFYATMLIIVLLRGNRHRIVGLIAANYAVLILGNLICYNICWPSATEFTWNSLVGLVLVFWGTAWLLLFYPWVINRIERLHIPSTVSTDNITTSISDQEDQSMD